MVELQLMRHKLNLKDLKNKIIAVASDHAGFDKKQVILKYFKEKGIAFKDFGCYSNESVDYPEFAQAIGEAIEKGEQQMILSPPRHGKTDLLIHFAVWIICTSPNIRILWVGGNEEIAKNAVSSVLDQLESNELLIEEICGPGVKFQPKVRSGKSWSSGQFTVGTRTITGIKSPTMVAVGKG